MKDFIIKALFYIWAIAVCLWMLYWLITGGMPLNLFIMNVKYNWNSPEMKMMVIITFPYIAYHLLWRAMERRSKEDGADLDAIKITKSNFAFLFAVFIAIFFVLLWLLSPCSTMMCL